MEGQPYVDTRYPLSAETARILAAAKEVHNQLGPGFEEVIYQRALAKELPMHGLEYCREEWEDVDFVQALSYLKASGFRVGLLINSGARQLQMRRLAN